MVCWGSKTGCAPINLSLFVALKFCFTLVELVQVPQNSLRTMGEGWRRWCVAVAVLGSVYNLGTFYML